MVSWSRVVLASDLLASDTGNSGKKAAAGPFHRDKAGGGGCYCQSRLTL
jgi:hypothetical protein